MDRVSLDTISGTLAYAMGIEAPEKAEKPADAFKEYLDKSLQGQKADRILMYNPDAIGQWVYEKHPYFTEEVVKRTDFEIPLCSVYPPVTPVCFGTMYTGAQPAVHGIQKYEKPVIQIDTLFDALIRAGKKPLIIAVNNCSLAKIFLERDMDYLIFATYEEVNAAAVQAIIEDKHDFIVVYNGNYDSRMHRAGPEAPETLSELKCNSRTFGMLSELVRNYWGHHNTLVGFAMDHGCHALEPHYNKAGKLTCGTHGDDIPEDMHIAHRYQVYPKVK